MCVMGGLLGFVVVRPVIANTGSRTPVCVWLLIFWVGWDDVTTSMQFNKTKCQQITSVTSFKNDNEPKNYVDEITEPNNTEAVSANEEVPSN